MDILNSCEHECSLGEFTNAAGADGDALEGSPAAGEQCEAAFAEAAGGPVQGVVGLVVRAEALPVGGPFDRRLDALACAVVAGIGQGRQVELGGSPVQRADDPGVTGYGQVVQVPGRGLGEEDRRPSGRMTAWMFPPGARCFPEYQALIVSPLTLSVVSEKFEARARFRADPFPAALITEPQRSGGRWLRRSSACWPQPNADGLVVAHVVPLVEGKRRELDRRDVCPGGPTGRRREPYPAVQSSTPGLRGAPSSSPRGRTPCSSSTSSSRPPSRSSR